MTVWIFFGSEEGGAGTGAGGGTDAVAGGATAGGGAAGAGAIGATAPDPRALGGEALWLGSSYAGREARWHRASGIVR